MLYVKLKLDVEQEFLIGIQICSTRSMSLVRFFCKLMTAFFDTPPQLLRQALKLGQVSLEWILASM